MSQEQSLLQEALNPPVDGTPPVVETPKAADPAAAPEAAKPTPEETAAAAANDTRVNPFKPEEIKLPEGVVFDEGLVKEFTELVNTKGVPRDVAQALVGLQEKAMKAASERGSAQWSDMTTAWRKEATEHPEFGGQKFQSTMSSVAKVVNAHGTPELKAVFDLTGIGNNPHFIGFLHKLSQHLTEPGPISGTPAATEALEARLYPTMKGT